MFWQDQQASLTVGAKFKAPSLVSFLNSNSVDSNILNQRHAARESVHGNSTATSAGSSIADVLAVSSIPESS